MSAGADVAPGLDASAATLALRELRRRTLGRSTRANLRWLLRAVGWGSIVYLIAWGVLLLVSALQSLTPLAAPQARAVATWAAPLAMALLALQLLVAARTVVTPVWLDRRDLVHLTPTPASAAALLAWPWWRAALPSAALGVTLGGAVAALAWRLLGVTPGVASAALLLLPSLTLSVLVLRWRAALAGGRDRLTWSVALVATLAAALAGAAAWTGDTALSQLASAPFAALLGVGPPGASAIAAWGAATAIGVATLALSLASWRRVGLEVPAIMLHQSEVLAELRAVRLLRALSAVQALPPDPGARFAAARARAALLERAPAPGPRWRPAVPRRSATSAFVWLVVVRAWRRSPWSLATAPVAVVTAGVLMAPTGPFGAAALLPSLLTAWAIAALHPGQANWPGFVVDVRARTLALGLVAGLLAVTATVLIDVARAFALAPPSLEGWLLLPLTLATAAVVDLLARGSSDPSGLDVWLLAGVLVATPGALAGWAGLDAGVAAPLLATLWLMTAWLRVVSMARLG